MKPRPIVIATRGSALALAQANTVLAQCREKLPSLPFALKILKTTGDKLQNASMSRIDATLPRGLFTKELETSLLKGKSDLAVHSLKDLPTELPKGLKLGGVAGKREDARDVFIFKTALPPGVKLPGLPAGFTVATSSTRRKAQMLAARPDLNVVEIRGNVGTRLRKLSEEPSLDGTILAAAGLARLNIRIAPGTGNLTGEDVPEGLRASVLELDEMLPCVGQAALGLEIREDDERAAMICRELNDEATFQCVTAERALLRALGGGCQTPLGAYAAAVGTEIHLRAVLFSPRFCRGEARGPMNEPASLGERVAGQLK